MASNKNFEYLGSTFQIQLINQIIVDKEFGRSIIDVIDTNYFENKYFKIIARDEDYQLINPNQYDGDIYYYYLKKHPFFSPYS